MRKKLPASVRASTDTDLPPEEIHLRAGELKMLESAVPFHHSPAEQEHMEPVNTDVPATPPIRHKWHDDHDAMVEDTGFDADVVLEDRHDKPRAIDTAL